MIKRIVVASVIVLLSIAGYTGWFVWRWSLRAKQVRTCAELHSLYVAVDEYRSKFGVYPPTLAQAVAAAPWTPEAKSRLEDLKDAWGNPFHYSLRGTDFILASYGRDGRPSTGSRCSDLETDPIASSKGVERCCGK